jgi:hypothetical protein
VGNENPTGAPGETAMMEMMREALKTIEAPDEQLRRRGIA